MSGEELVVGKLSLSIANRTIHRRGHAVQLGRIECQVLEALMQARGAPVSIARLCEVIWGEGEDDRVSRVRSVVKRLRGKLHDRGLIETIGNEGYRIASEC